MTRGVFCRCGFKQQGVEYILEGTRDGLCAVVAVIENTFSGPLSTDIKTAEQRKVSFGFPSALANGFDYHAASNGGPVPDIVQEAKA